MKTIDQFEILKSAYAEAGPKAQHVIAHASGYLFFGQQVYAMCSRGKAEPSSVDQLGIFEVRP